LTERRTTITRTWRAPGAPARRQDDMVEIGPVPRQDAGARPAPPAPGRPDSERREIGSRLENWARWATAAGYPTAAASQTGAICERLRKAEEGSAGASEERRQIDEADALLLEVGMRELETFDRLLLWWCYIDQARPEVVCRKLSIPRHPATEFVRLFRSAQSNIEQVIQPT